MIKVSLQPRCHCLRRPVCWMVPDPNALGAQVQDWRAHGNDYYKVKPSQFRCKINELFKWFLSYFAAVLRPLEWLAHCGAWLSKEPCSSGCLSLLRSSWYCPGLKGWVAGERTPRSLPFPHFTAWHWGRLWVLLADLREKIASSDVTSQCRGKAELAKES